MEQKIHLSISTYKNLIASLKELQLDDMADHLQRNVIDTNYNNGLERSETPTSENSDYISLETSDEDSSREDNFHTKLQVVKKPLSINVKKATKFRDRPEIKHIAVYPMRSNPRGMVLIIANNLYKKHKDRRPSAKHDEANLKKLFEEMGFKVITYFDLTGQEIQNRIEEFSQMPELRRVDSAFVIISSHGSGKLGHQETEILGIDYNLIGYKKVVCTKLMNYFTAEHCRNLSGKPKVFIFQTCRGKNEQVAVPRYTVDAACSSKPRVEERYMHFSETTRNYEDMLIVYSTIPGYVSYRDEYNGSWFIQILCEVFMNYAHKVHVQELFYMIDYRLKNIRTLDDNCQTPSITSQGFNKYCFINPGLFEEKRDNGERDKSGKHSDTTFKCCPNRKANIYICSQCESVYHYKCAKKLDNIKPMGKVKANCCIRNNEGQVDNGQDQRDNTYTREHLAMLKKARDELELENRELKDRLLELNAQRVNAVSQEMVLKNSEQDFKTEKLANENELLKQLNKEMKDNNELLKEKNDWLTKKLNKKERSQWVKRNIGRVLKKRRRKPSNIIEPIEI